MSRLTFCLAVLGLVAAAPVTASASDLKGIYLESRTCQVYTGPCFANAEVGASGRNAIMAWNIQQGSQAGVDLSGLSVVVLVNASDTLGFQGLKDPKQVKSLIVVDKKADRKQRKQLIAFAKKHSGRAGADVKRVDTAPIAMSLDIGTLDAKLTAGKNVALKTRKARPGDCICSNESAYYPPLAQVKSFAPGVTIEGYYKGSGLGARWSTPGDRSAYVGLFEYK